jgi:hypothetical protein
MTESSSSSKLPSFLSAASDARAGELLQELLETEAAPIIERVLHRKTGPQEETTDLTSATREELIQHLFKLRRGEAAPIRNFRAYVSGVAYNVWARELRAQHPARSMLLNRLQYLLENRTNQRGFSLWETAAGERLCGLARFEPKAASITPRHEWLKVDPLAAAQDAFGDCDWRSLNLAELLARLFAWLGQAIELNALVDIVAQLLEISDEQEALKEEIEETAIASPVNALKWQEYLRWLWKELTNLSMPQRTAFLLHSEVTIEFDFYGIASLRQIAVHLAMLPEELAEIWNSIPLDDLRIAARLGLERQQVINLRRVARDRLGGAWKKWIN